MCSKTSKQVITSGFIFILVKTVSLDMSPKISGLLFKSISILVISVLSMLSSKS